MDSFVQFCSNYDSVFNVLSSIATALAVFIGVYSIYEVRKQRESTYKPDLIIEEKLFEMSERNQDLRFFYDGEEMNNLNLGIARFHLCCYNIGFASAKKIKCEFIFNANSYIKKINKNLKALSRENEITFQFGGDKKFMKIVSNNSVFANQTLALKNGFKINKNLILPVSVANEPIKIEIPYTILLLFIMKQYYSFENEHADDDFDFNFTFKISFYDIGNVKRSKTYKIYFYSIASGKLYFRGELRANEIA